jgi:hypothetical protein
MFKLCGAGEVGCFMVYGYGLWFMVYGLWFMVYGLWFRVWNVGRLVKGVTATLLDDESVTMPPLLLCCLVVGERRRRRRSGGGEEEEEVVGEAQKEELCKRQAIAASHRAIPQHCPATLRQRCAAAAAAAAAVPASFRLRSHSIAQIIYKNCSRAEKSVSQVLHDMFSKPVGAQSPPILLLHHHHYQQQQQQQHVAAACSSSM